jgi:hypothetical protein
MSARLPGVNVGDEAVLIGKQGDEEIFVAELAKKAGTIPWEIFTGIGRRVERAATHRALRTSAATSFNEFPAIHAPDRLQRNLRRRDGRAAQGDAARSPR